MQIKVKKVILLTVAAAIGLMSIRLLFTVVPQKEEKIDTSAGVSYISKQEKISVTQLQTTQKSNTKKKSKKIKNNNFNAAYKDILLAGDSLIEAIDTYDILDSDQVYGVVGGSTIYLEDNLNDIVKRHPKYLVLHYGGNELGPKSYTDIFIPRYKRCIKKLQKKLPNTKIYVDSIFPFEKQALKSSKYGKNIPHFNKCMKEMAKELGVHFIDFTPEFKSYKRNYYDADGIHPIKDFYTEQYLPFVYSEVMSEN